MFLYTLEGTIGKPRVIALYKKTLEIQANESNNG